MVAPPAAIDKTVLSAVRDSWTCLARLADEQSWSTSINPPDTTCNVSCNIQASDGLSLILYRSLYTMYGLSRMLSDGTEAKQHYCHIPFDCSGLRTAMASRSRCMSPSKTYNVCQACSQMCSGTRIIEWQGPQSHLGLDGYTLIYMLKQEHDWLRSTSRVHSQRLHESAWKFDVSSHLQWYLRHRSSQIYPHQGCQCAPASRLLCLVRAPQTLGQPAQAVNCVYWLWQGV